MKASELDALQTHLYHISTTDVSHISTSTNVAHLSDGYLFCDNDASHSAICCEISLHFFERNVEPLLSAVSNGTVSPHTLCDSAAVLEEGIKVGVWCCRTENQISEALHILVLYPK